MEKTFPILMTLKAYITANPKHALLYLLIALVALGVGCAVYKTASKRDIAYAAGFAGAMAYLQEQGALSPVIRAGVKTCWEGFDANADKVTVDTITHLPDMAKDWIKSQGELSQAQKDKACAMVDAMWTRLAGAVDFTGLTPQDIVDITQGFKSGIEAALAVSGGGPVVVAK